jgi:methylenetetrahydrofolate dehydrogenase (NADP+) / methenyltetrahydrofolate cyclohydrolase
MTAEIIDGKEFATNLKIKLKQQIEYLTSKNIIPGLAVIIVGSNPASQVYVKSKAKQTKEIGMNSFEYELDENTSQQELIAKIEELNARDDIDGILVQLPLPKHISEHVVINTISPDKDVDGFHIYNAGRLHTGQDGFVPCTPLGCLMLIKSKLGQDLNGKKAVIIGRSNIVGKPMAGLLLAEGCTITVCHSKTVNLPSEVKQADIIVAAVGIPHFIQGEWVKNGAAVIDVGINRIALDDGKTKLVGDVDFDAAKEVAKFITPVPGGVGPMTIACLLSNTVKSACKKHKITLPNELQ